MPLELPSDVEVCGLTWDQFLDWFRVHWRPGQHVALIGPTGAGKSTFATGILASRRYVLALDPKGGDSTLATLTEQGYQRLTQWPLPREAWDAISEGRPARYIVGHITRTMAQHDQLAGMLGRVLEDVFELGGFTVYCDEFQLLADRQMMGLGKKVELLLIAARDRGSSVLNSYQAPAWVPTAASRQATWLVLWPTRDLDVVKKLAAIGGRDWRTVWSAMQQMPEFHVLVIGRNPRMPMIVTKAPRR